MKKKLTLAEVKKLVEHNEQVAIGEGQKRQLLAQFDLVTGEQFRELGEYFDRVRTQRDEARALADQRLKWKEGYDRRGKKIRDQRKEIRDLHKSCVRRSDDAYIEQLRKWVDSLEGIDGKRGQLVKVLNGLIRAYRVTVQRDNGFCPGRDELHKDVLALLDQLFQD